ncbi:MAG: hypothetical protein OEM26_09855, partial [Saprospiraceae bacterium]|nr:hypothetical protein [Saprospiraceae bacterium]
YEKGDWRDPFVYWDQDRSEYRMLIVARRNIGPYWNRGCIAQAISSDLDNWELLSPSESGFPKHQTFCPECPEIFPLGEYWYYVVSRFSEDQQTVYYVSQNPDGPWERRRLDSLEGRRFYAAKSATDGNRRISFAWIPFRQHNSDTGVFAWGGTFGSPRQLVSMKDGTLTMRLPQELDCMYERKTSLNIIDHLWGHWDIGEDIITISANNEYTFGFLNIREREDVMVSAEITITNDGTIAGILLEPDKDMGSGYFLCIDPLKQQVTLNKWPQDQDFHWETWLKIGNPTLAFWQEKNNPIVTRPLAYLPQDGTYVVKVLRKESAVECYVADQVCASFRIYKKSDIPFGIFVQGGRAVFRNLHLRK